MRVGFVSSWLLVTAVICPSVTHQHQSRAQVPSRAPILQPMHWYQAISNRDSSASGLCLQWLIHVPVALLRNSSFLGTSVQFYIGRVLPRMRCSCLRYSFNDKFRTVFDWFREGLGRFAYIKAWGSGSKGGWLWQGHTVHLNTWTLHPGSNLQKNTI